jgi:hypothetical protein
LLVSNYIVALLAARGQYFCLDTKVPKKSSQQGGFFALSLPRHPSPGPLPCKTVRTTAAIILPRFAQNPQRFCKNLLCPFFRSWPPLFCPFSPGAYLLTENAFFNMLRGIFRENNFLKLFIYLGDGT